MALNAISNLAPALVPIVVKLIDNFFSSDGTVTPPEIRERRKRNICHCEIRGPPTRYDVNQCSTCGRPYSTFDASNKQYLDIPTIKTRSLSSSDTCGRGNNTFERKSTCRGRSLSDGCQKRITDEDTLVQLGRRLEEEAMRANGTKYKLPSSSRGEIKKRTKKPEAFKTPASSSSSLKRF